MRNGTQPWPGEPLSPSYSATSTSMERMMRSQSAEFYRLVLASEPPDTLRELAQQGLSAALERSPVIDVAVSAPAAEELASLPFGNVTSEPASDDLIRDPFLNASSTRTAADKRAPTKQARS
ncbi:MAG: hypothetical protein ACJ0GY_10155 [Synechococcus sp.]